jgi:hypothetical protein
MQLRHLRVLFSELLATTRFVTADGSHGPVHGIIADMLPSNLQAIARTQVVTAIGDPMDCGGCVAPNAAASAVQK